MRNKNLSILLISVFFLCFLIFPLSQILAQQDTLPPTPPTEVRLGDTPNDNGHSITVTWKLSADDGAGRKDVVAYEILRSESPAGEFVVRGMVPAGNNTYQDRGAKEKEDKNYFPPHKDFYYKVRAKTLKSSSESEVAGPAQAYGQWFHLGKLPVFVGTLAFTIMVLAFIGLARKGKELYVRPLAGIDAVDDAIGRATEMGRPILYILGLGTAADIATIASFTILNRIAKKTAEHKTKIIVPCNDPIVMSVAQETVKAGYLDAGRPDMYQEENIFYLTSMQFAYVAAVNGIMLREQTATNFYLGKFYAESLILAETGSVAGSIQISGTDELAQIPFFVAATDFTLIGEELYAASAYLGREPLLLGALKAQDLAKAIVMLSLALGALAASFHFGFFLKLFTVQM